MIFLVPFIELVFYLTNPFCSYIFVTSFALCRVKFLEIEGIKWCCIIERWNLFERFVGFAHITNTAFLAGNSLSSNALFSS